MCQCQMASPGVIYMQCVNVKWRLLALYTLQCVNVKWRLLAFKPPDAYIYIYKWCANVKWCLLTCRPSERHKSIHC